MIELTCASCGRAFPVRPQSPKQTYCGALECQRERRRRWNRVKLRTDPDYRANQAAAQRAWHARNPEYWQTYRGKRKPGAVTPAPQRTLATIDASSCGADPDAGICWMEVCTPGPDGVPRAWRVELSLMRQTTVRKYGRVQREDSELLNVKPRQARALDANARARAQFEEVNVFIDRNGFAPGAGPEGRKVGVMERSLQARLRACVENPELAGALADIDRHGLLSNDGAKPTPASLDELLDSDDPLLSDPNDGIFELRHAKGSPARPDMVSEREPCRDFDKFKPLFDKAASELASSVRKSMLFANEQEIEAGGFFILNGVMVYVAEVRDPHVRNGKRNARLRLIFDNGTEGQNLLRSLATQLYKDPNGRRISDPNAGPLFGSEKAVEVQPAQAQDRITGLIYVVKSLSTSPEIARLDGCLFKIGFTTGTLETRLRGVEDDPTFLMAPVKPVMSYQAINLNANAFERLVHHFFGEARLDIEVKDRFGKAIKPREWFLLPLSIIEQAVPLIVDGSILRYRYDHRACAIVEARPDKSSSNSTMF